jgi:hypothetical protein
MTDVGVVQVLSPAGSLDTSVAISPSAEIYNYGIAPATFYTFCLIRTNADSTVYRDSLKLTNLPIGADTTLTFPDWPKPHAEGNYTARCSTALAGDADPANDTLTSAFAITTTLPEAHWVSRYPMLVGAKVKNVKDGGSLAWGKENSPNDTGYIYAFKGNGTYEFYRYNTASNFWAHLDSIPAYNIHTKKKAVKKGAALAVGGDGKVYAIKGNNCYDFWQYDPTMPQGTRWTEKPDALGPKAIKEGTGLAAVTISYADQTDTNYIYLLKGSGTWEFYRYNIQADAWETMGTAPNGNSNKPFKNGSCLTYDRQGTIYALKAGYNEFFAYSVSGQTWESYDTMPKISPPGTAKKKVKDGAGIAYAGRVVYALKGDNTNEFWKFDLNDRLWSTVEPLPTGPKKVKAGGALCAAPDLHRLYALRGNNTLEFWEYGPVPSDLFAPSSLRELKSVQTQSALRSSQFALRVAPNPFTSSANPSISYSLPRAGNITLALYDVSGRLVSTIAKGYHPAGSYSSELTANSLQQKLAAGIYILRLDSKGCQTTEKLVIE